MNRNAVYTVADLQSRRYRRAGLAEEWRAHLGDPELGQTIIVWGLSASGKSFYAMKLSKAFAEAGHKVLYWPLEEGVSASYQMKLQACGMADVSRRFLTARDRFSVEALADFLNGRGAPAVVVIDSLQYSGLRYDDYREIRHSWPRTTLIFVSHADGAEPRGSTASDIRYDAGIKVRVVAKVAKAESRFGGREQYIIDPQAVEEMSL